MIVGAYGPVVFSVSADTVRTFREGSRERGSLFAVQDVIGRPARIEPLTDELDQVELLVELDERLGTVPAAELILLNQLKTLQKPWPLFLGPVPIGEFVIRKIRERWKRFTLGGILASTSVSIELLEDSDGPLTTRILGALGV